MCIRDSPSYLFIHTNLEDKTRILSTPGIFFLVESQGRASTIPMQEIESIQRLVASGLPAKAHPYLVSGDQVQIRSGALQGVRGVLDRFKNQYRVVINVELLQRAVSIEVELSNLERLPNVPAPQRYAAAAGTSGPSKGIRSRPALT